MAGRGFANTLTILFFLFALFYFLKNLFLSEDGIGKVKDYRQSIERLQSLIKKEEEENRRLRELYGFLTKHGNLTLETFARDYLWLIPNDEQVFLKEKIRRAPTVP
jgi:cell division protein FtsB